MNVTTNSGNAPNYEPNSLNGPVEDPSKAIVSFALVGEAGRYAHQHPNDNYEQPRALFRKVMSEKDREHLIGNIVGHLG